MAADIFGRTAAEAEAEAARAMLICWPDQFFALALLARLLLPPLLLLPLPTIHNSLASQLPGPLSLASSLECALMTS